MSSSDFVCVAGTHVFIGNQKALQPGLLEGAGITHVLTVASEVSVPPDVQNEFCCTKAPVFAALEGKKFVRVRAAA